MARAVTTLPLPIGALVLVAMLAVGCTTVGVTATTRSSIEQRLITRALERAAAQVDVGSLQDRVVRLELYALTTDQTFAREFLRARLEARGIHIASGIDADVTLQVFAAALAVDTAQTLFGLPAMQAPVLGVPIPEVALFKWERSRGHAEVQTYLYDARGRFIAQASDALGEAKWDRFTVLVLISFAVTDLDERPPER